MALTVNVEVPPRDRDVLASWVRLPSSRAGLAQRARIVLLAGDRIGTNEIARRTGCPSRRDLAVTAQHPGKAEGQRACPSLG